MINICEVCSGSVKEIDGNLVCQSCGHSKKYENPKRGLLDASPKDEVNKITNIVNDIEGLLASNNTSFVIAMKTAITLLNRMTTAWSKIVIKDMDDQDENTIKSGQLVQVILLLTSTYSGEVVKDTINTLKFIMEAVDKERKK